MPLNELISARFFPPRSRAPSTRATVCVDSCDCFTEGVGASAAAPLGDVWCSGSVASSGAAPAQAMPLIHVFTAPMHCQSHTMLRQSQQSPRLPSMPNIALARTIAPHSPLARFAGGVLSGCKLSARRYFSISACMRIGASFTKRGAWVVQPIGGHRARQQPCSIPSPSPPVLLDRP